MNYISSNCNVPDWRAEFKRLEGAYAPSTLKSYISDVSIFVDWCDAAGRSALPASVETVCAFLEDQARGRFPASVWRRLYAIRKVHRLLRLPDPTWDEEINITLRRVRRSRPNRPRQAKGLTREVLERCIAVQPNNPWGLRNRAMISLGYDLLTRRSELVALRCSDIEMRGDGTLRAIIRRSKSDPFGMGRIAFSSQRSARLVEEWLAWRGEDIAHAREHHGVSERWACALVGVNRRVIRYEPTRPDDGALRQRLRELAAERRRFGYRRLGCLLAREGITPNHKKLLRIYREGGLRVRRRGGRKRALGSRRPMVLPDGPN